MPDEPLSLRERQRILLAHNRGGLSAWQKYCPQQSWKSAILARCEEYIDEPATRDLFDRHEESEDYPQEALDRLLELGLSELLSVEKGSEALTAYHICALNALTARRDTSLAVTAGVNFLGLLPAYLAANPQQLEQITKASAGGAFSSLLLSELEHGSNIMRNGARAERGILDEEETFLPVGDDEACTHYRLTGEKHLINGATKHKQMFACLRTRRFDAYTDESEVTDPMQARGDFTVFWLEHGPGTEPLPRWHTLPARAADISGMRFSNCIVGADRILGREHGGLALIHKTLIASRGGVAAFAAGCVSRARDLAFTYARHRNVYGKAIAHLGGIADHLLRLEALNLVASAISLKAAAFMNSTGLGSAHYTSVGKLMACRLAEEGVREGQSVMGARAMVRELPYERLIRDVVLFGVFDGTSHLMLEELSVRLGQESRPAAVPRKISTLEELRAVYQAAPEPVIAKLRRFQRPIVLPMVEHLKALDELGGALNLAPLVTIAATLLEMVGDARRSAAWKGDQGIRFGAAEAFASLEALIACIELCDPDRRAALGLAAPAEFEECVDRAIYDFAVRWLGARILGTVRSAILAGDFVPERTSAWVESLGRAEAPLLSGLDAIRKRFHGTLLGAEPVSA